MTEANGETPKFTAWRSIIPQRGWARRPPRFEFPKQPRPPAKKKGPVGRDQYGYRRNSPGAAINAVLTFEPQPAESIIDATGLPATKVSAHLRELIRRGHVEVSPAGFSTK
jgi:hypothetical protein